jgi:hypothetical protein
MADVNRSLSRSSCLRFEELEAREVPTSFGATRGLSVAIADVMPGDGQTEYITGTGPGRESLVRIWSSTGIERARLDPFPGFRGGVYVATGDVDNDGNIELIVSTARGTVGQVKVYAFRGGGPQLLTSFEPFGSLYNGGVQIATGDVTGDRAREIIVGRETGGSTVKVFSYDKTVGQAFEIRSFDAFDPSYTGGVTVAAANVDITKNNMPTDPYNYNYAEIVVGRALQLPEIRVFDAQQPTPTMRSSWMAFNINNPVNRHGINVAAGSTDGQRGAEIFVALKNTGTVRIFNGYTSGFLGAVHPYPPTYARTVNLYVNSGDDDFLDVYTVGSLVTVGADGAYNQIPTVFPGKQGSAAGLNGSFPAA